MVHGHRQYFCLFQFAASLFFKGTGHQPFQLRKGTVDAIPTHLLDDTSLFLSRQHLTGVRVTRRGASIKPFLPFQIVDQIHLDNSIEGIILVNSRTSISRHKTLKKILLHTKRKLRYYKKGITLYCNEMSVGSLLEVLIVEDILRYCRK